MNYHTNQNLKTLFLLICSKKLVPQKLVLAEVKHHPYLGVELSDDLTWATHIAKITGKANRSLNFISRNLYDCLQKVKENSL